MALQILLTKCVDGRSYCAASQYIEFRKSFRSDEEFIGVPNQVDNCRGSTSM